MLCRKPFMGRGIPYGCGQCMPCRISRRRQWTWRQYLESLSHAHSCFVTLTYDDAHLPSNLSLSPRHMQLWLKRIRFSLLPVRVRFFGVGEYGHEGRRGWNPHYHLSLFGVRSTALLVGATAVSPSDPRRIQHPSWPNGYVHVDDFNETTAQYLSGYVVKKLTRPKDVPDGMVPEFARMSLRPGIGKEAMRLLAETLSLSGNIDRIESGDVPNTLKIGRRSIPLGRFLLKALREACGFTPEYIEELKARGVYKQSLELSALLETALANQEVATKKEVYLRSVHQKILQTEARSLLFRKVGKL